MNEVWICGVNDCDDWNSEEFDTKEEAIAWGREEYKDYNLNGFYVGIKVPYVVSENIIDADEVLERINDAIYDDGGEYGADYLMDTPKEMVEEFEMEVNKVFHNWIQKYNLYPAFYNIKNVEYVSMPVHDESEDEQ